MTGLITQEDLSKSERRTRNGCKAHVLNTCVTQAKHVRRTCRGYRTLPYLTLPYRTLQYRTLISSTTSSRARVNLILRQAKRIRNRSRWILSLSSRDVPVIQARSEPKRLTGPKRIGDE